MKNIYPRSKASPNKSRIEVLESSDRKFQKVKKDIKDAMKKLEERQKKSLNNSEKLMEEISEKGSRLRNVLCHSCPQSEFTVKKKG